MFISSHKDHTKIMDRNDVVYKILCENSDVSYVGQTKRKLKTRISEHKNYRKLDPPKYLVVTKHSEEFSHNFNWNNIRILER